MQKLTQMVLKLIIRCSSLSTLWMFANCHNVENAMFYISGGLNAKTSSNGIKTYN